MRATHEKLLLALRELEQSGTPLSKDDVLRVLAEKSGLKPAAIKTYWTKNLHGVLVLDTHEGQYRVRGAEAMDEVLFEMLMGQNNLLKEAAQDPLRRKEVRAALDRLDEWLDRRDRVGADPQQK